VARFTDRSALMFGPDGEWSREGGPEFLAALGDPKPDYDATRFAISNLGFVRVMLSDVLVEITLCPRSVEALALQGAQNILATSGAALARVRYLNSPGQSDITGTLRQALMAISALTPQASCFPETVVRSEAPIFS
jgi:hypothetical protein